MAKISDAEPVRFAILATDVAIFTFKDNTLYTRLILVNRPPFYTNVKGLTGGLIHPKETADEAAARLVKAKAGIHSPHLYIEQLYTFSRIDRDPRGRVVAVAYLALVPWESLSVDEQADSETAVWVPVAHAKKLAYDHDEIIAFALKRLRSRLAYTTLLSKLMPKEFTLTELETAYEHTLGTKLDKRNFRKKILKLDVLSPLKKKRTGGKFRPAQLYQFTSPHVKEIEVL